MKKECRTFSAVLGLIVLTSGLCLAAERNWTTVLRSEDIIVGQDLPKMNPRRHWVWRFDAGEFEVAVRKSAIPIPAPQCRMEYLILRMPMYYPENPAQAPMADRKAVYDALVSIKMAGKGGIKIRFDALWYSRQGSSGPELTTCNIYFTLPLEKDAAKILP